jgi:hypothetical protein
MECTKHGLRSGDEADVDDGGRGQEMAGVKVLEWSAARGEEWDCEPHIVRGED